jgi:hypothetical protein
MELEAKLKNLKCLKVDEEFKQNLRKRILNEYSFVHVDPKPVQLEVNSFVRFKQNISAFFINFLRFNSALTLSLIIMLFISVGSYASMYILPESVKTSVSESFRGISKPKVDLEVVSNIEGASVYINDRYVGLTPLDIDVKEGDYAIRIEKDGYIAYQSDLKLDDEKPSNKINVELPKDVKINKWIEYANSESSLRFFYPDNWKLIEKKLENERKLSQIIVENGNTSLSISLDSSFNTELLNTHKDKIYIGEINVNDKIYKRYLVFNQFDEFKLGGIWLEDNNLGGKVNIDYNFDDLPQEQILSSEQLNLLDQISISYLSSQTNAYIYNPDSFKALENNLLIAEDDDIENSTGSDVDVVDDQDPEFVDIIDDDNEQTQNITEYINKVYGYKLQLPSNWSVSTGRAEYPLYDRGHLVEKDGKSYKIARLKIYTEQDGIIYIFMTNNDNYEINDGSDLCNIPGDKNVIDVNENSNLTGLNQTTKYNYQLCNKTEAGYDSQKIVESGKNGKIRYTIYWDATGEEINTLKDKFVSLVNSIVFDENLINRPIDQVEYKYKVAPLEFNYKYSWNITNVDVNCVVQTLPQTNSTEPVQIVNDVCKSVKVYDNNELIIQMTIGRDTKTDIQPQENQVVRIKRIGNSEYHQIFEKIKECTIDEIGVETCTETEKFIYAINTLRNLQNSVEVKYFKDTEDVYSLLRSIVLN